MARTRREKRTGQKKFSDNRSFALCSYYQRTTTAREIIISSSSYSAFSVSFGRIDFVLYGKESNLSHRNQCPKMNDFRLDFICDLSLCDINLFVILIHRVAVRTGRKANIFNLYRNSYRSSLGSNYPRKDRRNMAVGRQRRQFPVFYFSFF